MRRKICMYLKSISVAALILILNFAVLFAEADITENAENNVSSISEYQPVQPVVSGPVDRVPWSDNLEFIEAMEANSCEVMLAAYRTVLHDPLPGEENNVHHAARLLCGIVVQPGEVFSQNGAIGPYTVGNGYQWGPTYSNGTITKTIGGGVCKIASTLYNTAVLSNMEIVERNNHSMPVPYVPYGQDATVAYGVKDFKFRNILDEPVMIWAQGIDNILYIALYGKTKAPEVKWRHEVLEVIKTTKIYKTNKDLPEGQMNVLVEGMNGMKIRSWVIVKNGNHVYEKYMGVSSYIPMPWIIEKGG